MPATDSPGLGRALWEERRAKGLDLPVYEDADPRLREFWVGLLDILLLDGHPRVFAGEHVDVEAIIEWLGS